MSCPPPPSQHRSQLTKRCHYGMCLVLSAVEPFIQGLCWLMGFCFAAVSRGCLCAQRKLCSTWDTSENQHNCTNCSQFLTEWTLLSHLTTSRGTRTSHGPPDGDERGERRKKKKKNTQWSFSIQPDGRACNLTKKGEETKHSRNWCEYPNRVSRSRGRFEHHCP